MGDPPMSARSSMPAVSIILLNQGRRVRQNHQPTKALPALALAAIFIQACQLTPTFTTGYHSDWMAPATVGGSLAVRRFDEARPPRVYTEMDHMYLTWIPFVPYVSLPFECIDESVRILSQQIERDGPGPWRLAQQRAAPEFEDYTYPASVARAVADDLRAAKIFTSVDFVGANAPSGCRYVLSGTIHETPLVRSYTSFGLGMPGVPLWFAGLPENKTTAAIAVDLQLFDTDRQETIWQHQVRGELSRVTKLYTGAELSYGRDV